MIKKFAKDINFYYSFYEYLTYEEAKDALQIELLKKWRFKFVPFLIKPILNTSLKRLQKHYNSK